MSERLVFEGRVDAHNYGGMFDVGPTVGGRNVANEVTDLFGYGCRDLEVVLMVETERHLDCEGRLSAHPGFGGTDQTQFEPAEVSVGDVELLGRLEELDGRTVALTVKDKE